MGCRCKERTQAISRGLSAAVRGDVNALAKSAGYVARTLSQDARSGALRTAASNKLALMRANLTRPR